MKRRTAIAAAAAAVTAAAITVPVVAHRRPAPVTVVAGSSRASGRDPARTPGVLNPQVTQATITITICVKGWTATIRPPASYTTNLKVTQLASGYAYGGDMNPGHYEEDHLISLELGGHPTDQANLWPEPHRSINPTAGSEVKDAEENQLKAAICNGSMTLAQAQAKIVADW